MSEPTPIEDDQSDSWADPEYVRNLIGIINDQVDELHVRVSALEAKHDEADG